MSRLVQTAKTPTADGRGLKLCQKVLELVACGRALRHCGCNEASVRSGRQTAFQVRQPYPLDVPSQAQLLQRPDSVPVHINLIPREAMLRGGRMRMVIVVQSFAKGEQCHPPTVGRKIARGKAAGTPGVGRRIY